MKQQYHRPSSETKWDACLDIEDQFMHWESINNSIIGYSDIQMRWFQYRINHNILATKSFLARIGLSESHMCSFCKDFPETITHIFWDCRFISPIWLEICSWIKDILNEDVVITVREALFGYSCLSNKYLVYNLVICLTKMYFYGQKLKENIPRFQQLKGYISHYCKVDKFICGKNMNLENHVYKWRGFSSLAD